jgi:hypothetical protein
MKVVVLTFPLTTMCSLNELCAKDQGDSPVIEVSSFYGTQQSRRLPPLTRGRKHIQFPKLCVLYTLEYRTMEKNPDTQ